MPDRTEAPSRSVVATVAGGVTLAVAGFLSGRLIDEHGGVLGAVEWVLRTLVVIGAVVFIAGGIVLVLRLRRRVRPRPVGWLVALLGLGAFLWLLAIPVGYAVYLSHLPTRESVRESDLGASKETVTVDAGEGVRLRGWYVPSRNGAAVIAMHGTGGSRVGVEREARVLVRHGYGVLALDLPGHGESDGRSTSAAWTMADEVGAAVDWLGRRGDVEGRRIGLLGVSMGGEVALRVAPRHGDVRAVVSEGVMGGASDADAAGVSPAAVVQFAAMGWLGGVLVGEGPDGSDVEMVERLAPRPLLLISSGSAAEADVNRVLAERGGRSVEHWNLPDAPHGGAIEEDAAGYEGRVIGFLDRALKR